MNIIEKLSESFQKFPGIGPRQARRFVDFLIKQSPAETKKLAEEIIELKKSASQCPTCGYAFVPPSLKTEECHICQSPGRNEHQLMAVEKDVDLENIESSHAYQGRYFILGGTIKSLSSSLLVKKRFEKFFYRVKANAEKIKEIIIATSATAEGDTTALYLKKVLEPLSKKHGLKISRLGRGLSTGTELEYSDTDTIKNALENRQ